MNQSSLFDQPDKAIASAAPHAGPICHAHDCADRGTRRRYTGNGWRDFCDRHADTIPTLDPTATAAARDEAVDRVDRHAPTDWKTRADEAIEHVARSRPEFYSDHVWSVLDAWGVARPPEGRAFGPRMMAAVRRGVCEPTSTYVPSQRPELHGSPCRMYRSLVYTGTLV